MLRPHVACERIWRDPVYDGESISQEEHMYLPDLKVARGSFEGFER